MNSIGEYVDSKVPMLWYMTTALMPPIHLNREKRYSRYWGRWDYLMYSEEDVSYLITRYWQIAMEESSYEGEQ